MVAPRVLVEIFQTSRNTRHRLSEQDWPVGPNLAVDDLWGILTFSQGSGVQRFK